MRNLGQVVEGGHQVAVPPKLKEKGQEGRCVRVGQRDQGWYRGRRAWHHPLLLWPHHRAPKIRDYLPPPRSEPHLVRRMLPVPVSTLMVPVLETEMLIE